MSSGNSTTSTASASALPALDNTLGALYIGIVLTMSLWGVASLQVFYYFTRFPKDSWWMKLLVVLVWLLDSIHQGMITHAGYAYMVTNFGNVAFLPHITTSLELMILISGITCLVVQSFLVFRVWRLSQGNKPLVIVLTISVLFAFSFITAYFGKSIQGSTFTNIRDREWLGKASESLVVVSDFAIAGSLIYYLNRSRTGFKRTETMVNRLIIFTINTGLSTSIVATLTLLFLSLFPHNFIYVACFVCISKLYVNSLLATLNCRNTWIVGASTDTGYLQSLDLFALRGLPVTNSSHTDQPNNGKGHILDIKVDTETTSDAGRSYGRDKHPYGNEASYQDNVRDV